MEKGKAAMQKQIKQVVRCWGGVLVGMNILPQLYGGTAYAQAKIPTTLMSGWCGVGREGERLDINDYSLDEGDVVCQVKKLRPYHLYDSPIYELTISCNPVLGPAKTRLVTETFRVLQMEGKQYMLRAGGTYNPRNLALYKQC
jgi:hypothetical protein